MRTAIVYCAIIFFLLILSGEALAVNGEITKIEVSVTQNGDSTKVDVWENGAYITETVYHDTGTPVYITVFNNAGTQPFSYRLINTSGYNSTLISSVLRSITFGPVSSDVSDGVYTVHVDTLSVAFTMESRDPEEDISPPTFLYGEAVTYVGRPEVYTATGAESSIGDSLEYRFNWGDGAVSDWGSASQSHPWESDGEKEIRVQARCWLHHSNVSEWKLLRIIRVKYIEVSINVWPINSGSITINPEKEQYHYNEWVQVTAQPNPWYSFLRWDGYGESTDNPLYLQLKSDISITANMPVVKETVTTPTFVSGLSGVYAGKTEYFTAVGAESSLKHLVEYRFDWGDGTISDWGDATRSHVWHPRGTYEIRAQARCKTHTDVLSAWSVPVVITADYCVLEIESNPSEGGNVVFSPSGTLLYGGTGLIRIGYGYNQKVELSARPNRETGYIFGRWNGDIEGLQSTVSITMTGNTTIIAEFSNTVEAIFRPSSLEGPEEIDRGTTVFFRASGASSSLGHALEYRFDWGDNSGYSEWGDARQSHVWSHSGTFTIRAQARCADHPDKVSQWSDILLTVVVPSDLYGIVVNSPEQTDPGTLFNIDIRAEGVSDLFGLSFVLRYNEKQYIEPVACSLTANAMMGHNIIYYSDADSNLDVVSVGMSCKSGDKGASGSFPLVSVKVQSSTSIPEGISVHFEVTDITSVNSQGETILLSGVADTTRIGDKYIVWPGDANNDGSVNQRDILPIGYYWNTAGYRRSGIYPFMWEPQYCVPWPLRLATYADCNGDGVVNQADILGIGLNWGRTHSAGKSSSLVMQPPAGIIRPLTDRTSIQPGEKFTITVQAEDISSLFGLAFILSCESGGYLTPLDCSQGAFFADGSLFYYHMDTDNIAVALSRKAGETSLSGEGQLCTVRFAASSDIPEDMPVMFELRDITAGNGTGETVSLKSDPLTLNIESDAVDVASDETAQPVEFGMRQNYPNPFNSETVIEYSLPRTLDTSLIIYNLSGQNIRVLVDGEISSGKHIVAWNGRDEYGRSVGAGVYICWMRAGTFTETRRMLYLP